ncbi:hypothetical protein AR685_11785 [Chryseobacterium sp. JAH]|nr:hypothetical protein AR685_11785 [Chryseobacterium sp. JAH]
MQQLYKTQKTSQIARFFYYLPHDAIVRERGGDFFILKGTSETLAPAGVGYINFILLLFISIAFI